jgi:hypothetical protein
MLGYVCGDVPAVVRFACASADPTRCLHPLVPSAMAPSLPKYRAADGLAQHLCVMSSPVLDETRSI